jgi:NADH-quinone oxidoreductase subunit J
MIISSSLTVILTKNSLIAIIFLVGSFISSAGLLFTMECEFFALLFLIIYVGAIAVLFLFVVMMLDLKILSNNNSINFKYSAFGLFVALSFLFFVKQTFDYYYESYSYDKTFLINHYYTNFYNEDEMSEIVGIGQILYTQYVIQFLIAGLILSLAVLGVCVLTFSGSFVEAPKHLSLSSDRLGLSLQKPSPSESLCTLKVTCINISTVVVFLLILA